MKIIAYITISLLTLLPIMPSMANTDNNNLPQISDPSSEAFELARQAGVIAGTAKACQQNIFPFTQRVEAVIHRLAKTPAEKELALHLFHKTTESTWQTQLKQPAMACHRVIEEFYKLPLLQPDYTTRVLEKM